MTDAADDVIGPGRVAVVTGAASGIGRALAEAFARAGSAVVVADLDGAEAEVVAAGIRAAGGEAEAVAVDVSDAAAVDQLAATTLERFGRVDVLCNNAGVSTFNLLRDQTLDDWRWVFDVNLWGVVHGLQTFVPIMRDQGTPAHIVNTASIAGLLSGVAFIGPYAATKVAVVSISETLAQELAIDEVADRRERAVPELGRHPGHGVRARAPGRRSASSTAPRSPSPFASPSATRSPGPSGMTPAQVADRTLEAIRAGRFWIITHPGERPVRSSRHRHPGELPTAVPATTVECAGWTQFASGSSARPVSRRTR